MRRRTAALLLICLFGVFGPISVYGLSIEYAEGFSVEERDGYTLLHVHPPGEAGVQHTTYVLVSRGHSQSPSDTEIARQVAPDSSYQIVKIPVKKLIPLSTTFLPPLEWLDAEESLVAVDRREHIYSPALRELVKQKRLPQVGNGPSLNMEIVVQLQPAVVMANVSQGAWNMVPKLRRASVPVILNSDYLETTPLGRAEWIKFIGLLLGRVEEAEHRFEAVADRYLELQQLVENSLKRQEERPHVILNRPMNGRWVVPGGNGYMARIIEDAGGSYLWAEDEQSSSLVLDVEEVFVRALQADIWLHQYGRDSLQELLGVDKRLRRIKAVKNGNVVNNDARMSPTGSNDFFESGPYQPQVILSDLISLFHPALLPDHSLYYYRYLE